MINKRGQLGSAVITIYRVLVVIMIAAVILGASSMVYSYHINVRDTEAMLLIREVSDCVINDAVVDLGKLRAEKNLFVYCGFDEDEMDRFYVSVSVEVGGEKVFDMDDGDSGLMFVKDVFNIGSNTGAIKEYEPGHFDKKYEVFVLDKGVRQEGNITVEAVVNA